MAACPTHSDWENWMAQMRRFDCPATPVIDWGVNGHCDAFALALVQTLEKVFPSVPATLLVIERERVGLDSETVLEHNELSHVVVTVGDAVVDLFGPQADERWEMEWIQPDENDELEPSEDRFLYRTVSVEQLNALRQKNDQRLPDVAIVQHFCAMLESVLPRITPSRPRPK